MKACVIKCRRCGKYGVSKSADPHCRDCGMTPRFSPGIEFVRELELQWTEWRPLFAARYKSYTRVTLEIAKRAATKARPLWKAGLTPGAAAGRESEIFLCFCGE